MLSALTLTYIKKKSISFVRKVFTIPLVILDWRKARADKKAGYKSDYD